MHVSVTIITFAVTPRLNPDTVPIHQPSFHTRISNACHTFQAAHVDLSHNPKLFLTSLRTLSSNSALLSLHIFAASTFAGLSSFGSASMLITEIKIFSTDCIGDHLSDASS